MNKQTNKVCEDLTSDSINNRHCVILRMEDFQPHPFPTVMEGDWQACFRHTLVAKLHGELGFRREITMDAHLLSSLFI